MRIPSPAGTRDPERSRFFHKLSMISMKRVVHDGFGYNASQYSVTPAMAAEA